MEVNTSKKIYWALIFVGVSVAIVNGIMLASTVSKQIANFYCYVPENATVYNIDHDIDISRGHIDLITSNNSTLDVYCIHPEKIEQYRGKYIILSLAYSSIDDESGYSRHIHKITIQNGTYLGYYPNGVDWYGYYHFNHSWDTGKWYIGIIVGVAMIIFGIWKKDII